MRGEMLASFIHHRLGKHVLNRALIDGFIDIFHVIAIDHAHAGQRRNFEKRLQLPEQRARLMIEAGLFFNVQSVDHFKPPYL